MTDPRIEAAARELKRLFSDGDPDDDAMWLSCAKCVLDAADAAAWRPIESAPSGIAVLVMEQDGFCAEAKKHTRGFYKGWWVCSSACDPKESLQPTHWQPLPAPPVNEVQR